jgi:hypothetical protein
MTDAHVIGGPGEGSGHRHIWMTISDPKLQLDRPVAMCGAAHDGRAVEPGANKHLPVCELCKTLVEQHNRGARLGGRIEVQ